MRRSEEFEEIRRLLGYPKEQCPSADIIVGQLLREEQWMHLRLASSSAAWNTYEHTLTTTPAQQDYVISPQPQLGAFIRPLFAFYLNGATVNPIRFTQIEDYVTSFPSYEFVSSPQSSGSNSIYTHIRSLGFYRTAGDTPGNLKVRVFPVPEAQETYKIILGVYPDIDSAQISLDDTAIMPEWSMLRTLRAALFLLPYAEWDGVTKEQNRLKRNDIANALAPQMERLEAEFNSYIRNPVNETIADVGYWYE
jgi:hypothetical protein